MRTIRMSISVFQHVRMHGFVIRSRMVRTALLLGGIMTAGIPAQYFTPIINDFSAGLQPFIGTARRDTAVFLSTPSSMRISDPVSLPKSMQGSAVTGAYAGTVVQAGFWVGTGFPTDPIRFYCKRKDLTFGAAGHEMDIHVNVGSTDNGYTWLGIFYLKQGAFTSGEWEVGMDATLPDIGSMRNPWAGQPTFQEKFDQLYGTRTRKPAVVLTLVIETMKGAVCIDDISVTMQPTSVGHSPQLTVRPVAPETAGAWRVVSPNGRILGSDGGKMAFGCALPFRNGRAFGTITVR